MKRLLLGATGASGLPVLVSCLRLLKEMEDYEVDLLLTEAAKITLAQECEETLMEVLSLADTYYGIDEIGAKPASGSYLTEGMLIVPCSMKTVAGIASGYADNLLLRSADVTVKEGRPLVLAVRETPLSPIHLSNMERLSRIPNVYLMPPMLTFYNRPKTIEEMTRTFAARLLTPFGIRSKEHREWIGV